MVEKNKKKKEQFSSIRAFINTLFWSREKIENYNLRCFVIKISYLKKLRDSDAIKVYTIRLIRYLDDVGDFKLKRKIKWIQNSENFIQWLI